MQGPKWLFLLILFICGPCVVIGTEYVPWVELPVQRRFCSILMSGVGLPDIHDYSTG